MWLQIHTQICLISCRRGLRDTVQPFLSNPMGPRYSSMDPEGARPGHAVGRSGQARGRVSPELYSLTVPYLGWGNPL